ncbi:MAG: SPOR domain-containing protein [Wenzhouxiangella sp.]
MKRFFILTATLLIAVAMIAGCDTRQRDWEEARQADSLSAYQEFLEQYPDGEHADTARQRISEIREQDAWETARERDTVEAYQAFVDEYPDSTHAAQASSRISELERTESWSRLQDSRDISELTAFVQRYPDSEEADRARERIEQLEAELQAEVRAREEAEARAREEAEAAELAAAGGYRVQLAAFRAEDRARSAAQQIESRHESLLQDIGIEILSPDQRSSFFRLVTSRLTADAARNLCTSLKDQGQDCLVISD